MVVLEILGLLLIILFIFGLGCFVGVRVESKHRYEDEYLGPPIPGSIISYVRNLLLKSMLKGMEVERAHKSLTVDDMDKEINKIIDGFHLR